MVVATGFFDGVHLGHRRVIERLVSAARERGTDSCIVTFWPHPRTVLKNISANSIGLLSSLEEKCLWLRELGVDKVEVIPFTESFSRLSTREYLREVIIDRLGGSVLVLGYDNRMGNNSAGTDEVARVAGALGLEVIRVQAVQDGGRAVSSTLIRETISAGDVDLAAEMLGRQYQLIGKLSENGEFRLSDMQAEKLIPGEGSYSVSLSAGQKNEYGECRIDEGGHIHIMCCSERDFTEERIVAFIKKL